MRLQEFAPSPPANDRLTIRPRRRQLISLTPLIDVVFILLVFFMLASSFLDWRSIELNTPGSGQEGQRLEGTLLIEIRQDSLRLSGETLTPETLIQRIKDLLAKNPDRRILVRPAENVIMQDTVTLLDSLAAAGVTDLSLIASSKD